MLKNLKIVKNYHRKVAEFNAKHGENTAEIEIKEQYRNMKQQFEGKCTL